MLGHPHRIEPEFLGEHRQVEPVRVEVLVAARITREPLARDEPEAQTHPCTLPVAVLVARDYIERSSARRPVGRGPTMSTTADRELATPDPGDFGQPPRFLRPFVDAVARVKATVHHKLLAGFLVIALLLLSMGVVSVVVLERIDGQVERLTALSNQVNQARADDLRGHRAEPLPRDGAAHRPHGPVLDREDLRGEGGLRHATCRRSGPTRSDRRPRSSTSSPRTTRSTGPTATSVTKLYDAGLIQRAIHAHIDQGAHAVARARGPSSTICIADVTGRVRSPRRHSFASAPALPDDRGGRRSRCSACSPRSRSARSCRGR